MTIMAQHFGPSLACSSFRVKQNIRITPRNQNRKALFYTAEAKPICTRVPKETFTHSLSFSPFSSSIYSTSYISELISVIHKKNVAPSLYNIHNVGCFYQTSPTDEGLNPWEKPVIGCSQKS